MRARLNCIKVCLKAFTLGRALTWVQRVLHTGGDPGTVQTRSVTVFRPDCGKPSNGSSVAAPPVPPNIKRPLARFAMADAGTGATHPSPEIPKGKADTSSLASGEEKPLQPRFEIRHGCNGIHCAPLWACALSLFVFAGGSRLTTNHHNGFALSGFRAGGGQKKCQTQRRHICRYANTHQKAIGWYRRT